MPHAPVHGPGEGPFFVAEQLAFQERFGNGHAVDHQEGLVRAQAVLIDGPRHQFLARARFSPDEDRGVRGRHPAHGLVDLLHGLAAPDDGFQGRAIPGTTSSLHPRAHEAPRFQGLVDEDQDLGDFEGLEDVVEGAHLGGLDGGFRRSEGGHDDDGKLGLDGAHGLKGLEAVHARHAHVHDDEVEPLGLHHGQAGLPAAGRPNGVAFLAQELLEALPQMRIVVNDQDRSQIPSSLQGSVMMKVVPFPSRDRTFNHPLWSSMIRAAMLSPRPVPSSLVLKNG